MGEKSSVFDISIPEDAGVRGDPLREPFKPRIKPLVLTILAAVLVLFLFFTFSPFSPTYEIPTPKAPVPTTEFVNNPEYVENPDTADLSEYLDETHIHAIAHGLEMYKLRSDLVSETDPFIWIQVQDTSEDYTIHIKDNKIVVRNDKPVDPDMIIRTNADALVKIAVSDNVLDATNDAITSGDFFIRLERDEKILLLKGYLELKNKLVI